MNKNITLNLISSCREESSTTSADLNQGYLEHSVLWGNKFHEFTGYYVKEHVCTLVRTECSAFNWSNIPLEFKIQDVNWNQKYRDVVGVVILGHQLGKLVSKILTKGLILMSFFFFNFHPFFPPYQRWTSNAALVQQALEEAYENILLRCPQITNFPITPTFLSTVNFNIFTKYRS